jgi:hypothetical protein
VTGYGKRLALGAVLSTTIALAAVPAHGQQPQATRATVVANPLVVELRAPGGNARTGSQLQIRADVTNLGEPQLSGVLAELRVPPAIKIRPTDIRDLGILGGDASETAAWQICSDTPGSFVLLVAVAATTADGLSLTAESGAIVVEIAPGRRPCPRAFG